MPVPPVGVTEGSVAVPPVQADAPLVVTSSNAALRGELLTVLLEGHRRQPAYAMPVLVWA